MLLHTRLNNNKIELREKNISSFNPYPKFTKTSWIRKNRSISFKHIVSKKKKKPIQHVSSRKHSRLSSNRQRANIAGDVDVFRYWILILVGLSNCLLSRNTNGLVNFWNIDTTSTHSKSFLPSKKNRKRKKEK